MVCPCPTLNQGGELSVSVSSPVPVRPSWGWQGRWGWVGSWAGGGNKGVGRSCPCKVDKLGVCVCVRGKGGRKGTLTKVQQLGRKEGVGVRQRQGRYCCKVLGQVTRARVGPLGHRPTQRGQQVRWHVWGRQVGWGCVQGPTACLKGVWGQRGSRQWGWVKVGNGAEQQAWGIRTSVLVCLGRVWVVLGR